MSTRRIVFRFAYCIMGRYAVGEHTCTVPMVVVCVGVWGGGGGGDHIPYT